MLGIRELRLYDTDAKATAKLEQNLRAMPELGDLRIMRASSSADACKGANIVTTVTADKRNAVILTPPMIAPGMHLNAVGGDCPGKTELHSDVLRMPNVKVFVEYEAQSRIEGEIQQMEPEYPVTEFADLVRGSAPGRADAAQITIFDSVGFALEDYSALRFLHGLMKDERGGARQIDLVPELDDPKDLYGGTVGKALRPHIRKTA
jgi:ornithine cyclodeaminase